MDDDDREYLNYVSKAIHERHHEETWQQIRGLFWRVTGSEPHTCGKFKARFLRLHGRSEVKKIIHRMSEILFAAEIAVLRRSLIRTKPQVYSARL